MAAGFGPRFAAGDAPARRCNLERFLEATTPVVASSSCSSKVMGDDTVFHFAWLS
ncbi:DUF789 family protein [Zea mays]|uniref:DUF789 family protein n=1 Tax=Zea mays TaxID=4577 RepID=A0A1D6MLT6_MAIZE|nr:DUF789 family protein [Zea mays]